MIYQTEDCGNFYEVSNLGNIRNSRTRKVLQLHPNYKGYLHTVVTLGSRKKIKAIIIHRAIAETFIENPNSHPQINHVDGNKCNNSVSNLEWCTGLYNIQHAFASGLFNNMNGCNYRTSKFTANNIVNIIEFRKNNMSVKEIASRFKVSTVSIYSVLNNKRYLMERSVIG